MKIKLDENLPLRLAPILQRAGHDVDTVLQEGLGGKPDHEVWLAAQAENRFLITQDLDFSDMRRFEVGHHAGLLLVRLHHPGVLALSNAIAAIASDLSDWGGCLVVS